MRPVHVNAVVRTLGGRTSRRMALKGLGGGAAFAAFGGAGQPGHAAARGAIQGGAASEHAYRLAASEPVEYDGGRARIVTQAEFPALKSMALRLEELDPGAVQTPHWHPNAGEVHYVAAGEGVATVVSPGGEHAGFALRPGSVSFFPLGHYHAIHNTGAETMRIIAAHTHENPTVFTAGEVFGIAPRPIMAQILGVPEADFPEVPESSPRPVVVLEPAAVPEEPAADPAATAPDPYTINLDGIDPAVYEGGTVTNVRARELARLDGISFLPLYIEAGGVRELHWHPNASEIVYVNSGEAEIGLAGPGGLRETFTIGAGDLAFFPQNWIHYVASIGPEPLDSIVYLSHAAPARIDLSDAVGFMPRAVTAVSLGMSPDALDGLPERTGVVVAGPASALATPEA